MRISAPHWHRNMLYLFSLVFQFVIFL